MKTSFYWRNMIGIKIVLLLGVASGVYGGLLRTATYVQQPEPLDAYPQYNYGYSVQDPITGDVKRHEESRDGDLVRGQYSFIESDGSLRTVTYTAGKDGFHAVVDRQVGYSAPTPVFARAARPLAIAQPSYAIQQQVRPQQFVFRPVRPALQPVRPIAIQQIRPQPVFQPIQFQPIRPVQVQPTYPIQPQQPAQPVDQPQQPEPQLPVQTPQPQPLPVQPQPQPIQPQPDYPSSVEDEEAVIVNNPQQPTQPQAPVQPQPQPLPTRPPQQLQPLPTRPPQQPQPLPTRPPQQPQPLPTQAPQIPENDAQSDDAVIIDAQRSAQRADVGVGNQGQDNGSSFSFRSSRDGQFNFNVAY